MEMPRRIVLAAESLSRINLREAVVSLGHKVVGEANNAQDAVCCTRDLRPDLLILDMNVPGLEGFQLVERVVEDLLVPVLLLALSAQDNGAKQTEVGVTTSYLAQPFSEDELGAAIAAALASRCQLVTAPPPKGKLDRPL